MRTLPHCVLRNMIIYPYVSLEYSLLTNLHGVMSTSRRTIKSNLSLPRALALNYEMQRTKHLLIYYVENLLKVCLFVAGGLHRGF